MSSIQVSNTAGMKIIVKAEREIAYESPDHLMPWGTKRDNSTNHRFNDKLYRLFPERQQLKVLDLGCSGGGFVKNCIDDGCFAIGLEGSDYSKRYRRAEWRAIPEYLFTGDVTGDFEILLEIKSTAEVAQFDVVTCWEMMEHITELGIPKVVANVKKHLATGGIWIMSVSPRPDIINGVNLHQTVQPKRWWINKFAEFGLTHLEEYVRYFNTQFIRGPKYGTLDSFHLVLSQDTTNLPPVPKESLLRRLNDRWIASLPQKVLAGTY